MTQLYQSRKTIEKVSTKRKSIRKVLLLLFRWIAWVNSLLPSSTFFVASTACKRQKKKKKKKKKSTKKKALVRLNPSYPFFKVHMFPQFTTTLKFADNFYMIM